jgi:hypothetical protein
MLTRNLGLSHAAAEAERARDAGDAGKPTAAEDKAQV